MNGSQQLLPNDEPLNIKQMVLESNAYTSKFYGFYRGIVIQNNDPERRGRVKIFVSAISPQIYDNWYTPANDKDDPTDKSFRFPAGKNIYKDKDSLKKITEQLKAILPWAEQAASLVGSGSSGLYIQSEDVATISDATNLKNRIPGPRNPKTLTGVNVDSLGEKPGHLYEIPIGILKDGFGGYNVDQMPEVNPFAFQFKPSTYSNCTKGLFTVPDVGANVWVFFENGDIKTPIYFAYSYDKNDWQKINEMVSMSAENAGINYPGAYENNIDKQDKNLYKKGKTVFNSKGGTIEIVDTDDNESFKITHPSGTFLQFHRLATTRLITGNDQKLVLKSLFETVKGNKNVHVEKGLNLGVDETRWTRIGDWRNRDFYQQWVEAHRPFADIRSRFAIHRCGKVPRISDYLPPAGSIYQSMSGSFAPNPVLSRPVRKVVTVPMPSLIYRSYTSPNTSIYYSTSNYAVTFAANDGIYNSPSDLTDGMRVKQNVVINASPTNPQGSRVDLNRITPLDFDVSANITARTFTGFDPAISPSSQDGNWKEDEEYKNIDQAESSQEIIERLLGFEQNFGPGGDDIIQILRHKQEVVGSVLNNYQSVRVDPIGRINFSEMLVCANGAYPSQRESPLVERVSNDGKFPCGNYTLTICNKFICNVGSGGINFQTTGTLDLAGSQVVVSGSSEVIMSSTGDVNISSGGRFSVTASIITFRQSDGKQVAVDGSLGVKNNVIIGGSAYVEGELYVHHISAPAEVQETEATKVFGTTNYKEQRVIGFIDNGSGNYTEVYSCIPAYEAYPSPNCIIAYEHSHNFLNVPLNLHVNNESLRNAAGSEVNILERAAPADVIHNGKVRLFGVGVS